MWIIYASVFWGLISIVFIITERLSKKNLSSFNFSLDNSQSMKGLAISLVIYAML